MEGSWTWGGESVFGLYSLGDDFGFSDFAGSGIVHMAGAAAALAGVLAAWSTQGQVHCGRSRERDSGRQSAAGHAGYLHSVDGLVRLQWRFGAQARRHRQCQLGGHGVPEHQCGGRRRPGDCADRRPSAVRQGRPDHGAERRAGWPGGDHRRAFHPVSADSNADWCGRRSSGGVRDPDPRQDEDRRPGRCHLGARSGRLLGPDGGAADQ